MPPRTVLVTALENPQQTDSYRLATLGEAVAALAARMEPQEAARIADRMVTALENPQQTDSYRLAYLGKAVAALAARMEPQEAARIADRMVTVLENPQQTDSYRLSYSRQGSGSAGGQDGAAGGGAPCRPYGDGAGKSPADRWLPPVVPREAVAALAARMEPQEAARLADRVVTALENPQQTDGSRLLLLGRQWQRWRPGWSRRRRRALPPAAHTCWSRRWKIPSRPMLVPPGVLSAR